MNNSGNKGILINLNPSVYPFCRDPLSWDVMAILLPSAQFDLSQGLPWMDVSTGIPYKGDFRG